MNTRNPAVDIKGYVADLTAIIAIQQKIKVDELVKVELLYAMNYKHNLN